METKYIHFCFKKPKRKGLFGARWPFGLFLCPFLGREFSQKHLFADRAVENTKNNRQDSRLFLFLVSLPVSFTGWLQILGCDSNGFYFCTQAPALLTQQRVTWKSKSSPRRNTTGYHLKVSRLNLSSYTSMINVPLRVQGDGRITTWTPFYTFINWLFLSLDNYSRDIKGEACGENRGRLFYSQISSLWTW